MRIFNSHVHSNISKDGKSAIEEICMVSCNQNLSGISITDHCEISSFISGNAYNQTKNSIALTSKFKKAFSDRIFIGIGIEVGNGNFNPQYTARILQMAEYDVVLASVHVIKYQGKIIHLSRENWKELSSQVASDYIMIYFQELLETAKNCDYDILSHLTLPLRYANGEYNLNIDLKNYQSIIDSILTTVIERDKSIEVNSSEVNRIGLMPDKNILMRYRELGGYKITIGSDAHKADSLTHGINDAIACLRECGFKEYGYYNQRKYVPVSLD